MIDADTYEHDLCGSGQFNSHGYLTAGIVRCAVRQSRRRPKDPERVRAPTQRSRVGCDATRGVAARANSAKRVSVRDLERTRSAWPAVVRTRSGEGVVAELPVGVVAPTVDLSVNRP